MPLEFATICLVYYVGELKILPLIAGLIFMTFSAVNSIYWQDFYSEFNSNAFIVFCVFILSLSLFYLYQLLQINTNNSFVDFPLFWISVAFSVFSLINLVVLGTHNSIAEKQSELSTALSNIRFFSNYLLYLLFIPAFLSKQATLKGD
jgi:quinol-cytochrome oxidoreductase complex cytochrome b subunit